MERWLIAAQPLVLAQHLACSDITPHALCTLLQVLEQMKPLLALLASVGEGKAAERLLLPQAGVASIGGSGGAGLYDDDTLLLFAVACEDDDAVDDGVS